MKVRFKEKSKIFDVVITAIGGVVSIGTMIYGVFHFGLRESWPELVLNVFYIACIVMMWMFFFNYKITPNQFNYGCSLCVGATIFLRDILFLPPLASNALHIACVTLSELLLLLITFFYARKEWQTYTKRNLWMICIVDMVIAALYTIAVIIEPINEYTEYMLTEIWIRPTITYGMVTCFVTETKENQ